MYNSKNISIWLTLVCISILGVLCIFSLPIYKNICTTTTESNNSFIILGWWCSGAHKKPTLAYHCHTILDIDLTTLLTSPIEFSLYFQNYVRHLTQNFREVRKIYEMGLRSKFM